MTKPVQHAAPPSTLGSTYSLTGDRHTELAIESIAKACAERGDVWQALPVQLVETDWKPASSVTSWRQFVSDPNTVFDQMRLTAGSYLGRLVDFNWAKWVAVEDLLGIELTTYGFGCMIRHGCIKGVEENPGAVAG